MRWGPETLTTEEIQVLMDHMLMNGCRKCKGARTAVTQWLKEQEDIEATVALQILSVFLPEKLGKRTMEMMLGQQEPLAVPILFETVRMMTRADMGRIGPAELEATLYIEHGHVGIFRTLFERQSSPEFSRLWLSSGPPSSAWDSSYNLWMPMDEPLSWSNSR